MEPCLGGLKSWRGSSLSYGGLSLGQRTSLLLIRIRTGQGKLALLSQSLSDSARDGGTALMLSLFIFVALAIRQPNEATRAREGRGIHLA